MARPERNNVDYFPYLVDEGEKMYYIDNQYGNDGFATFIKILTSLAKTDFHYLDLSKRTTQMFLSAKCKVSTEILLNIITDLAELGKFNLMLWNESKIIWCQDFIDSIQDAYKKRNNECITFDGLLILLDSLGVRKLSKLPTTGYVKPQSKVEYTIEEESKEEETKENEIFSSLKSELIDALVLHFGFTEMRFSNNQKQIFQFVNSQMKNEEDVSHFKNQFKNYQEYKKLSKETIHNFTGFLGTPAMQFQNAAWNLENWGEKLNKIKSSTSSKGQRTAEIYNNIKNPYE